MLTFIKTKKKLLILLSAGLLAAGLLAGCGSSGSSGSQPTATPKVLRVGSETTFPPFEFVDNNNKFVGFDIDIADALAKKMGYKMEFKSMGFDALIPALRSGDIDMIAAGLNATPERAKVVAFSDVYFNEGGYTVIVKKTNTDITGFDTLNGKTIGAQIGTVPADMAKAVPGSTVKEIDSNAQLFNELNAGTIDAIIIDRAVGMYYLKQGADKDMKIVGEPTKSTGTVLAFRKDDKELVDKANQALKEMRADGTYQKIYDKWFGASGK